MFSWLEYPVVMDIRPSLSTRSPSVTREPLFSRSRSSLSSRMLLPNCSPRQPNHFFHCRRSGYAAAPFFPQPAGQTLPQPHTPAPDFGALEALAPAVYLVAALPAATVIVDAEGARGPVHPLGHIIKGGKAVGGQHQKAVQFLLLVFLLQTGLGKQRGIPLGAGAQIRLAGLLNKSGIAVGRQHFADHLAARLCAHAGAGIHQQRAAVGRGRTVLHADKALCSSSSSSGRTSSTSVSR